MKKIEYEGAIGAIGNDKKKIKSVTWQGGRKTVTKYREFSNKKGLIQRETSVKTYNIMPFLKILVLSLLIAALFRYFYGFSVPTFDSFLKMLQTVPEFMSYDSLKTLFSFDWTDAPLPEFIVVLGSIGQGLIALITLFVTSVGNAFRFIGHIFVWFLGM